KDRRFCPAELAEKTLGKAIIDDRRFEVGPGERGLKGQRAAQSKPYRRNMAVAARVGFQRLKRRVHTRIPARPKLLDQRVGFLWRRGDLAVEQVRRDHVVTGLRE